MTAHEKTQKSIFFDNSSLAMGSTLTAFISIAIVLSCFWTPYDIEIISMKERFLPPSPNHWLGTDHLGRDMLSMIMIASRNCLGIVLIATVTSGILGTAWGCLAAMGGSLADEALMRFADLIFSFPAIISAIIMAALWGHGAENVMIALAIFNTPIFARIARSATLSLRSQPFIMAAYSLGKPLPGVIFEHILPNIAGIMAAQTAIRFSICVLAESGLSYAGLGFQPPSPSLGRMLADSSTIMNFAPHLAIVPAAVIALSVFSATLMGEGLERHLKKNRTFYRVS